MNGILVCAGEGVYKNIGDYIQSVAQEQFFDNIDCYIEREYLNKVNEKEPVNVIMNGWFMWKPENFPPNPNTINPLFVSFHLVPTISKRFFTSNTIDYLKKHQPIGTRDYGTKKLMDAYGIKSYFSGCLTLTLGLKYKSQKCSGNIYFVDPYYELALFKTRKFKSLKLYLLCIKYLFKLRKLLELSTKILGGKKQSMTKKKLFFRAISFYHIYSKIFSDEIIFTAEYICHEILQTDYPTNDSKMDFARSLIKKYAEASLVITSRIHCALPCLGVETPVIYIDAPKLETGENLRSPGRMKGLIELLNVINFNNGALQIFDKELKHTPPIEKITLKSKIYNSKDYESIRDSLIEVIKEWKSKNRS